MIVGVWLWKSEGYRQRNLAYPECYKQPNDGRSYPNVAANLSGSKPPTIRNPARPEASTVMDWVSSMAEKRFKSGRASDPSGADVEDLIQDWRRSVRSRSDVARAVTIWNLVMFFATPIAICLFGVAGLWCEALAAAAIVFQSVARAVRRRRTVATLALYEDERLQRVMLEALGDRSRYVRNTAILWLSVHCKAGSVKLPGEISEEQAVSLSRALRSRCGEIRAASGDLLARLPASATLGRPRS